MKVKLKNNGFSLTEVLMAVGILAVGLIFIAGTFPAAIYFTTIASERTTAAAAADEAFAKIQLYGIRDINLPADGNAVPYEWAAPGYIYDVEFCYPSATKITGLTPEDVLRKRYFWSAVCRRVVSSFNEVQITVFVCRKINPGMNYYGAVLQTPGVYSVGTGWIRPVPVPISVSQGVGLSTNEIIIDNYQINGIDAKNFINDNYTIVDGRNGQIYRVLERYKSPNDRVILLDKNWFIRADNVYMWVVPPGLGSSKYPCIGVFQKVIRF